MSERVLAVIPARYGSTRFPGKPLANIQGKPMVQHVWERAQQAANIDRVIIATDDARILDAVTAFGGEARMTSADHPSGTDRVWEVAANQPDYGLVFNVQGDEPFLDPAALEETIGALRQQPDVDIMTTVTPIETAADYTNPNIVKAVIAEGGRALYFSRAVVPYCRDHADKQTAYRGFRHLGLYLYRRRALERFTKLPPSPLEQTEKLEQLRALEAGMTISAVVVTHAPVGIDSPEDLARLTI